MYKLSVLVASLRKDSNNKKLARALTMLGREQFSFESIDLENIPFFNEDMEKDLPTSVVAMKNTIVASDGVLIITPEYNRSFPAILKNALDWGSRPYSKGVWGGKCMACIGMSPGPVGTAVCQAQLRSLLGFLGARQMTLPEVYLQYATDLFASDGSIAVEKTRDFLASFLTSFAAWITANSLQGKL